MSNSNFRKRSLSKATWKHKGRHRVGYGGKQGLWDLYATRHSVWLGKVIMDRKKKAKRQSTRVCYSPPTKTGERSTHLTFRITLYLVKYEYAYICMLAQNQSMCEFPFCSWLQEKNDRIWSAKDETDHKWKASEFKALWNHRIKNHRIVLTLSLRFNRYVPVMKM